MSASPKAEPGPPSTDPASHISAVVVLAAGAGTRMRSGRPKVLHEVAGHSMLFHAISAATAVQPQHIVVVVGHMRDQVEAHLAEIAPHVKIAVQEEQLGTGHAVQCALADLEDLDGDVIVTMGDVPMLNGQTLANLVTAHYRQRASATVLTATVSNPEGYGRIIRDDRGQVMSIVEQKDASGDELAICEINSGIYVFSAEALRTGLNQITADNAQQELYLTQVVSITHHAGQRVGAHVTSDVWQTEGVNDRIQLSRIGAEVNRRILIHWMQHGVTIVDPNTTWIHASVSLAADATLLPGTSLEGATSIGAGATIGPDTTLVDVEVGAGTSVTRTHGSLSVIGAGASVGPFAYLRPGTTLGDGGKIGTFVEAKNAQIAAGAKVPHLSYAGDAVIGEGANIGAGTIFANYDGVTKATTVVGAHSFVGSNSVLMAPVTIDDGAYVAAGSAIGSDVKPGELGVARGKQRNIAGWVARKRAGTKTARSAESARQRATGDGR